MNRDHAAIQRVLILTFLLNLAATAAKLGVGLMTGALSLIADGLDTLFDGLSNVIGVIAVRMGSQPPDEDHPYGHRKYETLAALIIAILLFVTAWEVGQRGGGSAVGSAGTAKPWSMFGAWRPCSSAGSCRASPAGGRCARGAAGQRGDRGGRPAHLGQHLCQRRAC